MYLVNLDKVKDTSERVQDLALCGLWTKKYTEYKPHKGERDQSHNTSNPTPQSTPPQPTTYTTPQAIYCLLFLDRKVPNKLIHTMEFIRKEKSKDQTLLSPSDELIMCDLHNHTHNMTEES